MSGELELSVVVPMFNEVDNVPLLWGELEAALAKMGRRAEIVFVDDGSTDGSGEAVQALMKRDTRVRLLSFEANAGLSAAFKAGYAAARAPIVVTMDADLQNDPADVERLLAALGSADAAVGYRERRRDRWRKRISSRIANAIRNRVTGDRVKALFFAHGAHCPREEPLAQREPRELAGTSACFWQACVPSGRKLAKTSTSFGSSGMAMFAIGISTSNSTEPRRSVLPAVSEIAPSDRPQGPGAG